MGRAQGVKDQFASIVGERRGSNRADIIEPETIEEIGVGERRITYTDMQVAGIENNWQEDEGTWVWQDEGLSHYLDQWQEENGEEPHWDCRFQSNTGDASSDHAVYVVYGAHSGDHTKWIRVDAHGTIEESDEEI